MANLNDIYIDTIVGQLHTTMSDFLKMKANYILLENEFQNLVGMNNQQSQMIEEKNAIVAEQIERIKELENKNENLKQEKISAESVTSKTISLQQKVDSFTQRITELKTDLNNKDGEIHQKDAEIGVLNQEIKLLNAMIKDLKNPPGVQPIKKKVK